MLFRSILGTAAYMSPEQAKGQPVDKRSDVWAFGCVLHEMLTGRRTFEGDSVAEVVGGVFKSEPDWALLPRETPEGVRRLLRRCLQKDRRLRLQSIGDARIEIEEAQRDPPPVPAAAIPSHWRAWLPWTVAALLALLALLQTTWSRPTTSAPAREVRFEVATPGTTDPVACHFTRRLEACFRCDIRGSLSLVAAQPGRRIGPTDRWDRRRIVSVLVAKQSLARLLYKRPAQSGRSRRWIGPATRNRSIPTRRGVG